MSDPLRTASEYLKALVTAFLLAVVIRSFIFEPFKIPSPSMVPTLLVGDHIFVERYAYGLRVPLTKYWLAEFDDPKRGDVVVFTEPLYEKHNYIKRVIGLPGDVIEIKDGILLVNGEESSYKAFELGTRSRDNECQMDLPSPTQTLLIDDFEPFPFYRRHAQFSPRLEVFPEGHQHIIQRRRDTKFRITGDFKTKVPADHFFVMGDNRDESQDSRFIGPIPRENLKGRAVRIWLSMNNEGGNCPGDQVYGWMGSIVDVVAKASGAKEIFHGNAFPSIRWDRFWRRIQ